MKREIKFRVFFYDGSDLSTGEMLDATEAFNEGYIEWDVNGILQVTDKCSILMQYTGLKDYYKKEIYEGDILSNKWRAEVYRDIRGTWMVRFHNNPKVNKPQSLYDYLRKRYKAGCAEDCSVIGSIYTDPELTKYCDCEFVMIMRDRDTDVPYCSECKKEVQGG